MHHQRRASGNATDQHRPQRGNGRRILFHGLPAYGHLYPMLPLAAAAQAAGYDVVFATGAEFSDRLRRFGFRNVAAGVGPSTLMAEGAADRPDRRSDGKPDEEAGIRMFLDLLPRRTLPDLLPIVEREQPDLIVFEETSISGFVAAARTGLPAVTHGLVASASVEVAGSPVARDILGTLSADFGVDLRQLRGGRFLDIFPDALQTGARRAIRQPLRPVPWRDPHGQTPSWLVEASTPAVYLTLGTVFAHAEGLRRAAIGIAESGVEVLLATGPVDPGELGALPERVHVERFVDQARVLPLVDAVVHHGGSGTTLGAASYALPQLVLPVGADQYFNGQAVQRAGFGRMLTPDQLEPEAVREAVDALLADAIYTSAALRVQHEIADMPAPAEVLEDLLDDTAAAA